MPGSRASLAVTTSASSSWRPTLTIATKSHSPVTEYASATPSTPASSPPRVPSASRSAQIRTTAVVIRAASLQAPGPPSAAPETADPSLDSEGTMKTGIHPEYVPTHVRCTCGNEFWTRSTKPELHVEICSNCHPFYTGRQKLVDTGGRVERFRRRAARRRG